MSEFNRFVFLLSRGRTWPSPMSAYHQPSGTVMASIFVLRHNEMSSNGRGTQIQGIVLLINIIKGGHVHYLKFRNSRKTKRKKNHSKFQSSETITVNLLVYLLLRFFSVLLYTYL